MPLRKYRHILTFFLLFEAIFLLSLPFFDQNETPSINSTTNYRENQEKRHIIAAFYLKNRVRSFQANKIRFHSLSGSAITIFNSGFSYLKSDYHWHDLAIERLTKLMLFPYHSFW
ncbi:hypothetical protein [Mucilaginibacter psychrotolerans]|uniref:Uncharacterized protein n=1 Tax=Mucilaginibacter psychrotolerans TaxID=1524096 RepID=A0A4Y8SND0_9SPHI|nr:hypothetical protein [Mucilaginibacter psychrotolerans]TFF40342.1 hypothetical protein E2R66_03585 [Mucilaginibacter psychrotolerans]